MNNSSTHAQRASKDFTNLYQKKKSIPISINTNPNPGQFLFKNNLSNIATSYKDISEKIQNIEKQKMIPQSKCSTNSRIFNNFLSVNTKNSHLSNHSSVSNNSSNIISQRVIPAKNLSTVSFPKGFLMNALNANNQKIAISNRNYLQVKTENSLASFLIEQKENKNKEREVKKAVNNNYKSKELVKKNTMRQKSIGTLPSSEKNLRIEYRYMSNEIKHNSTSNNHNHNNTTQNSKATLSYADDQLYKQNFIKKKISMLRYNLKSFIQIGKQNNKPNNHKILHLTTKANQSYTSNNNVKSNNIKKRGLSHDMASKDIQHKATNSQANIQTKGVIPKKNRTISINQLNITSLQSTLIDIIKEKKNETILSNKAHTLGKIPHQPIQVNVQPNMLNSKLNSNIKQKNALNEALNSEAVTNNNDEEQTDRDMCNHNEDKYNMFDYLLLCDNSNEHENQADTFDDLNSIVRAMDFKCVSLKEQSMFNDRSELYRKYEQKFNNCYDMSANKAKFSERKKMNISVSTQENSYKKCLSPFN